MRKITLFTSSIVLLDKVLRKCVLAHLTTYNEQAEALTEPRSSSKVNNTTINSPENERKYTRKVFLVRASGE